MEPIFKEFSPARKMWMLVFIFSVSFIIFSILSSLFLIPVLNITSLDELNKLFESGDPAVVRAMKMVQLVASIGSFIVPAHIFSLLVSGNYKSYFGFDKIPALKLMGIAVITMICAQPLINAMATLNEHMSLPSFLHELEVWMRNSEDKNKIATEQFLKMNSINELLLNIFIVAVIPAIGEEMFFRGAMQKTIIEWGGGIHKGIWISAIVFSAFHFQFFGFFPRMVLGALFGYMMIWGRTIWLPIVAHFTNNAGAVILSYLIQKEYLPKGADEIGSVNAEIIYTVISILIVGACMFYVYKYRPAESEL